MSNRILTTDEMNRLFAALLRHEARNLIAGGALVLAAQAGLIPPGDEEPGEEYPDGVTVREGAPVPLTPAPAQTPPGNQPAGYLPEKKKPGRPKNPPAVGGHLSAPPGYPPQQLGPAQHGGSQAGGPRPGGQPQ